MPELPEIRLFADSLNKALKGKGAVKLYSRKEGAFDLKGAITDVVPSGKELFFMLDYAPAFKAHLMLSGEFVFSDTTPAGMVSGYAEFDGGVRLYLIDDDGLATLQPAHSLPEVPQPTDESFTYEYFDGVLSKKGRSAVKSVLTDQKVIRGIGNAYADEILYDALVAPRSVCSRIPPEIRKKLYESIISVLDSAVKWLRYAHPGALGGEFRDNMKVHVYGRKKTAAGEEILSDKVSGRKTLYTKNQILY